MDLKILLSTLAPTKPRSKRLKKIGHSQPLRKDSSKS